MYNETFISQSRNIFELFGAINETSGDVFVGVLMLLTFIIIFVMFSNYPKKIVILVDSLIMTFLGILLFISGLIGWAILFAPIAVLFISILMALFLPD